MIKLFKNSAKEEANLLKSLVKQLPSEYDFLTKQLDQGLIRDIKYNGDEVMILFNPSISSQYEDKKGEYYYIKGLVAFDNKGQHQVDVTLKVAYGLLMGYSVKGRKKKKLVPLLSNIGKIYKEYRNADFPIELVDVLDEQEKKLINPNDVYKVNVEGQVFFHVFDLEDGDFIGIDRNKIVYKITHDPLEIVKVGESLQEYFLNRS